VSAKTGSSTASIHSSAHARRVEGGLTGVMLLNEGRILAATPRSTISAAHLGEWPLEGQILIRSTPGQGREPRVGGHEVGIGFFGTCDDQGRCSVPPRSPARRSLR